MKMNKKWHYVNFQMIYFIFVSGFGFFFPYFNVYLEQNLGFSGSEIGIIISISLLSSVAISPLWGMISDRTGKYKLLLKALLFVYAFVAWLLFQTTTLFFMIVFATIMEVVGIGMGPMLDVLAVDYCERTGKDFGKLRIAGSLGWIFGSYGAGFLMTYLLFDIRIVIFWPLIVFMILAGMLAMFLPEAKKQTETSDKNGTETKLSARTLLKNKAFIFLMVFNFLTLALIDAVIAFAGNHLVLTLEAAPSVIGWMNVIAVLPEVIFFLFATRLMMRIGIKRFYIFSVLTLILRFAVYATTEHVGLFLAIGAVGPMMMAVGGIGNFLFIKKHVKKGLIGTAFVINVAILTLGRAIFSLIFGVIYQWYGSFMLFKFSIVCVIVALIILLLTKHFDVFDEEIIT